MAYPKTLYLGGNPDNPALVFESQEHEESIMASGFFAGYIEADCDDDTAVDATLKRGRGRPRKQQVQ